ncbi:MAG: type IV pilus modification protein PilV [Acidovorax sp.]|nr:type IV pilus modification protein PilV [Acidovorax sp.]
MLPHPTPSREQGVALMEVLVAMLITAFGILGYVGLQARTTVANLEAYQRSQALILVNDMAQRINLNRANADAYVANDIGASPCTPPATGTPTAAQNDICAWASSIQGAGELQGSTKVGAMLNARGCIAKMATYFQISIAWQGLRASGAPAATCGQGQFSAENLRRTVSVVVQIANLSPTP